MDAGTFEELGQIGATMAEEAENAASLSGTRIIGEYCVVPRVLPKLILSTL